MSCPLSFFLLGCLRTQPSAAPPPKKTVIPLALRNEGSEARNLLFPSFSFFSIPQSVASLAPLLLPQRHHRIHSRCSPCRNDGRGKRHRRQQRRHRPEGERICRAYPK